MKNHIGQRLQLEGLTAFEYGLTMMIRIASATQKHDGKIREELARIVRKRLIGARVASA